MRDVAARAGVAPSTVSRVLAGIGQISPQVRERVLLAAKEANYRPNLLGRTLRTAKTDTIAYLLPDFAGWSSVEGVRVVQASAREAGYGVLVGDAMGSAAVEHALIEDLLNRRIDGALGNPINPAGEVAAQFAEQDIPLLFFSSQAMELPGRTAIAILDGTAAAEQCVRQVLDLGHRTVGLAVREQAFKLLAGFDEPIVRALARSDCPVSVRYYSVSDSAAPEATLLQDGLRAPDRPTLLFVTESNVPEALEACRAAALVIGRDISVVALGDSPWLRVLDPPLAAIGTNVERFASAAVAALLRMIADAGYMPPLLREEMTYTPRASVAAAPDLRHA
jgi:LacI family transcriptional regulator